MKIISTIHDPNGIYLELISEVEELLHQHFSNNLLVTYSTLTSSSVLERLKDLNFEIRVGGTYGEGRIAGLESYKNTNDFIFYIDFDKILHWLKVDQDELIQLLSSQINEDSLLLGRTKKAFATYPDSWKQTETIANNIASKYFGKQVDVYTGTIILNKKAKDIILENSIENGWGSCSEWPMLLIANNVTLSYSEFDGLSWEDPDRARKEINEVGLSEWTTNHYGTLDEWMKRSKSLVEQLEVIKRIFHSI